MLKQGDYSKKLIKIGVLSDTHLLEVDLRLREIVDTYFAEVDIIIHIGDMVTSEVLRYLQTVRAGLKPALTLEAVHGNMDYPDVQSLLPGKKVLEVGPFRIGIIHGWGPPGGMEDRIQNQFENVQCIIFGHTHNPVNRMKNGILFFNPGSPTDKRFARKNTVGILEIGEGIQGIIIPV
ncbi:MAG: metallophosphoesterase family protein [Deltaproteobacteria bacterium]|nr:metallophosphoesterase family protein [Deltaproteobacteria bacterium]MBW2307845.1 metallophosphoesterase family protein [Deltaproteobacteria bacterium]